MKKCNDNGERTHRYVCQFFINDPQVVMPR